MKKIIAFLLALVLACSMLTVVCSASSAGEDIFINIDGIDGLSVDSHHRKWIDGLDYKLNYAADGTVTGVTFTHLIEPATTEIIEKYMGKVYIRDAKLNVCQNFCGKQFKVLDIYMKEVLISGYKVIVLDDGRVAETVTLRANEITVTETPIEIGPDGQPIFY